MKHYLLSVPIAGGYMHGYWMSSNVLLTEGMSGRLLKAADEIGAPVAIPVVLATTLSQAGADRVRELIRKRDPGKGKTLNEATDFHMTIFTMPEADPANSWLLALH